MQISTYKRKRKGGVTWYANIRIRQGEGEPSLRHREAMPGLTTKYDAETEAKNVGQRFYEEKFGTPKPKDKPLSDFITEDYLPWAETNKKHPGDDRSILNAWVELESLKGKTLRQVSTFDIEKGKIERARGKTIRGKVRAHLTINTELIIVSSFFHRAMDAKIIDVNPCSGVERFHVAVKPPRVLSFDEEEKLLPAAALYEPFLVPFITLALGTGMREMEMLTLRKTQLDFTRDLIFITDPKWPDDPRASKGIPMSKRVRDVLWQWVRETESEYVFPSSRTPTRHRDQMSAIRRFNILCDRVGIKGLTIHKLRHTFGTRLGDAGYSTQEIADLMGHSDIRMARIYVHTSRDRQRSAVESVWSGKAQVVQLEKAN